MEVEQKMSDFADRTTHSLNADVLDQLRESKFCIVGCGAVGSAFAEMLVRTEATNITLIDGDKVEISNLNRAFTQNDINQYKVNVVSKRLKKINPKIKVEEVASHFKEDPQDKYFSQIDALIKRADIIILAMDVAAGTGSRATFRKKYAYSKKILSIGVKIVKDESIIEYECLWDCKKHIEVRPDDERGYGPKNGSFYSIIMEATAVGFNLLLHCLEKNPKDAIQIYKKYKDFICCHDSKPCHH